MTFKDTINDMVKSKVNDEGDKTVLLKSEDTTKKFDRAAIPKSRSRMKNVQYNDLNVDINQKDIDRAAKKYHKEMKNRRRQQNGEDEMSHVQPKFLPVLTQMLFKEIPELQPGEQLETQAEARHEMRPRPHLRSHLRQQKHMRSQKASHEHGQHRQRSQEREIEDVLEASLSHLKKHLKQHSEKIVNHLGDQMTPSHQSLRTREELLQDTAHIRLGNPKQVRLRVQVQHEQGQVSDDELSHGTRIRQKLAARQHSMLENPELSLDSEEICSNSRRQNHLRQHQQNPLSKSVPNSSSRQRHQRKHVQVQSPQEAREAQSLSSEIVVPRHSRQSHTQTDQTQVMDGPETPSKQRRQRHLAQQRSALESPIELYPANSECRLRQIVEQHSPQTPVQRHFASVSTHMHLRSPINHVVNEGLRANEQRPRVQNSPRILHPCDRLSFNDEDTTQVPPNHEDRPPSDEYYAGNEAEIPPYHATLHKYLDLISYDPRVVPCLRVNRRLIKSNDKLSESIFQFLKFNLFPESIDPWEISHIDDHHYDDLIPDLIPVDTVSSDVLPTIPYEPRYGHHSEMVPQLISDDDYEYALYLSTLENNVHNYNTGIGSTIGG